MVKESKMLACARCGIEHEVPYNSWRQNKGQYCKPCLHKGRAERLSLKQQERANNGTMWNQSEEGRVKSSLCHGGNGNPTRRRSRFDVVVPRVDPKTRFFFTVEKQESGCWLWKGKIDRKGYGVFSMVGDKGKSHQYRAHRISYTWIKGAIPDGLQLDHLCRVRNCVNPDHLEPVTGSVNILRGRTPEVVRARAALITHCPQGHPYEGENLIKRGSSRMCRICTNARSRANMKRKREFNLSKGLTSTGTQWKRVHK